jgi:peptidoglycan/LPS O-acetylase OafA/YrhL
MSLRHPVATLRGDLGHDSRWPALEGVRGIAIIGVVVYHVVRAWVGGGAWNGQGVHDDKVPEVLWWLAMGRLGVDVLFVLSGFLVYRSWESIRKHAPSRRNAIGTYAFRRGQRIMPAYWLSLAVFIPWLAPELLEPENWRKLLLFLTAQSYWVPRLPDMVNTVYWTLTTEILFYVLLPVLAIGLRRHPWAVWAACVVLSTLWVHGNVDAWRGDLPAGWIAGRLDQFVLGAAASVALARHEAGRRSRAVELAAHPATPWLALAGVVALSQYQGSILSTDTADWWAALLHPALAVCFGAIVVHLTQRPAPTWTMTTWLRFTALISYSIYLWHFPILVEGIDAAGQKGSGLAPTLDKLAVVALLLVVVVAISTASYLLAERAAITARARRGSASAPAKPAA